MGADLRVEEKVKGTVLKTFWTNTTGSWQAVTVPSNIEVTRGGTVQVHAGDDSIYTNIDNPVQFWISSESDGTGALFGSGFEFGVGKKGGEVIFYIKAAASQKIATMLVI